MSITLQDIITILSLINAYTGDHVQAYELPICEY